MRASMLRCALTVMALVFALACKDSGVVGERLDAGMCLEGACDACAPDSECADDEENDEEEQNEEEQSNEEDDDPDSSGEG